MSTARRSAGPAPRRFQYAKSTDPDVIAVIEANWAARMELNELCRQWAKRFGADGFYPGMFGDGISALALDEKPVGHGAWVWYRRESSPGRPRGVLPGTKNPLLKEMRALSKQRATNTPVPGLADHYETALPLNDRRGDYMMFWPTPFVALGAAWIGFSMRPTGGDFGPQWDEVKASEWHAAKEAWEDAHADAGSNSPCEVA